jgi:hypothetical protein
MPRGTDLSRFSQKELDRIANRLSGKTRQTLGFDTPASIVHHALRQPARPLPEERFNPHGTLTRYQWHSPRTGQRGR